jgi:tRNA 5-methylaminomethyl-2-thiouridine biosynthesis bifunctional protein
VNGATIAEAPIAIVATGARPLALRTREAAESRPLWSHLGEAGLVARTGRTTIATVPLGALPGCVLGGDGHAIPLDGTRLLLGPADDLAATDGLDAATAAWRRFAGQLADCPTSPPPHLAPGPSGTRLSTRDHLPLAGPMPDLRALRDAQSALRRNDRLALPVLPGLHVAGAFGGRGLLWSVLAAELLAARLDDEPSPLERPLAAALDPGRFLRRRLRRDTAAPGPSMPARIDVSD